MRLDQYTVPENFTLPAADHAERTILGALLLDSTRLLEVAAILGPDDFSLDSNQRIFMAMLTVAQSGSTFDFVTLAQVLADRKEIECVGGVAYICSLTEGMPGRPVIDEYIKIVKDKSLCRRLLAFSDSLSGRAWSQDESGLEIASWGTQELARIAEAGVTRSDVYDAQEVAEEAEYRLIDAPVKEHGISSTIAKLDDLTGGIRKGELWIIGASPSRGKTTLARQIVAAAVSSGIGAYVHSGEMTKESWFDITACLHRQLPSWKMRDNLLNLTERELLREGLRDLGKMPFHISDAASVSLDRLIWNATRLKRKKETEKDGQQKHGIDLLVVDYAQIINSPGREKREQVTNVAFRLRDFAKTEKVAVVLLSQSPRPEGRNLNARPNMHSLKESGALEEAAHVIVLPYRPVDEKTSKFTGEDELIIGKNRNGVLDSINVTLNGTYLKFEER